MGREWVREDLSFISEKEVAFVRKVFADYYRARYRDVSPPPRPESREYGYFRFGEKVMVRHLSFGSVDDLRSEIVRTVPLHVYRSAAYYTYPSAPMEEKGWNGADLIFDIDADHVDADCIRDHTYVVCPNCGLSKEMDANLCGRCGSALQEIDWVCERCLAATKTELIKLIDVLSDDFGVGEEEMEVAFSGNRGYHLVIYSEEFRYLDQSARRDLINYLTASGLEPALIGIPSQLSGRKGRPKVTGFPEPNFRSYGWRGRILRRIYSSLLQRDETFASLSRRYRVLSDLSEAWRVEPSWAMGSARLWKELSLAAASKERVNIDPVVTQDLHRLLRLTGTLNGKTGLLTKRIGIDEVTDFDPLKDAVALDDEPVNVRVIFSPRITIGDYTIDGIEEPTTVKLPLYVATYLVCKGLARVT